MIQLIVIPIHLKYFQLIYFIQHWPIHSRIFHRFKASSAGRILPNATQTVQIRFEAGVNTRYSLVQEQTDSKCVTGGNSTCHIYRVCHLSHTQLVYFLLTVHRNRWGQMGSVSDISVSDICVLQLEFKRDYICNIAQRVY